MKEGTPKIIQLKDYKKSDYSADSMYLDFQIMSSKTLVRALLKIKINPEVAAQDPALILDGENLVLKEIKIDGKEVAKENYKIFEDRLEVKKVPHQFELETLVEIDPANNKALEGLYQSGDIYCTQCEAQGFRKITYYFDRPDVMATFKVRIEADQKKYPQLLSNGNRIDSGLAEKNRHWVLWQDPFKKPCYLFALVAGDLALVKDKYKTSSGRNVALEIYVDKGNEDKCEWAMSSLKKSMKWDEETFGLEYDLDLYMIVAVDAFNMGAMENKGLNIFNSHYVLAKKETATDMDFINVEGVIGHEYFHNWTGNRVTCRDWFQLTLKEGLTVFRDQEFTSDMNSRPVKRIKDAWGLRSHQFAEDAGPMAHPIRPQSYIEINNFYTSTVYDKGAEVIRMIHTIVGKENFRKGMDLYFKRHDGQAVTTVDFVNAMEEASQVDLTLFRNWYDQAGTPIVEVKTKYDAKKKKYEIMLEQKVTQGKKLTLHIPLKWGLVAKSGQELARGIIHLKEKKQKLSVDHIESECLLSINRNFSAPIILKQERPLEELALMMMYDKDEFNRWDAAQNLYSQILVGCTKDLAKKKKITIPAQLRESFKILLSDNKIDHAFKSLSLTFPSETQINDLLEQPDYDHVHLARKQLARMLTDDNQNLVSDIYQTLDQDKKFELTPEAMGKRSLKNKMLGMIYYSSHTQAMELTLKQFHEATNMTDEMGAFSLLVESQSAEANAAIEAFYQKWSSDFLVMNKWFAAQASATRGDILEVVKKLESHPKFDKKNPNMLRSLYGSFAGNIYNFNKSDGSGYEFIGSRISEIDEYNPQVAARFAGLFNRYKKVDKKRQKLMGAVCEKILKKTSLSKDTFEILTKTLES